MEEDKYFVTKEIIGNDPITNELIFQEQVHKYYSDDELALKFIENLVENLLTIKKGVSVSLEILNGMLNTRLSLVKEEDSLEVIIEELNISKTRLDNPASVWFVQFYLLENHAFALEQFGAEIERGSAKEFMNIIYNTLPKNYDFRNSERAEGLKEIILMNLDYFFDEQKDLFQTIITWYLYNGHLLKLYNQRVQEPIQGNVAINEVIEKSSEESKEGLTTAQRTLALVLINKFNKFNLSQDKKDLVQFVCKTIGRNERAVYDVITRLEKSDFKYSQMTPKKSLLDYKTIKPLFEGLENKTVISFIDRMIVELEKNAEE